MTDRLTTPWWTLRVALGAAAFLAGLDKFFNLLANWPGYLSPLATAVLPMSAPSFMHVIGIIEMVVGAGILLGYTRLGGYVAAAWDRIAGASLVGRRQVTIALFLVALLPMASTARAAQATHGHEGKHGSSAAATLRQDMRTLWTDHAIWTREYIVAAVGDQPDQQAAANRLMKNQEDIGAAVAAYYGQPAGARLTELLKAHIAIAVDLIKAAKAGNSAAQQQADQQWHTNAEDIADFLSKANPNWPRATLVAMMNTHLSTTTDEVVARLTKNWEKDVRAFDAVYHHILGMSDALADGIIKQFPAKF
jgi:hypothetical protein